LEDENMRIRPSHVVILAFFVTMLVMVSVPSLGASSSQGAMYLSDPAHTGVYDNGGVQPGNSVLWKYQAVFGPDAYSQSLSSPIVDGGVVYAANHYIFALDAGTGALKWKYKTGDVSNNLDQAPTPAVVNGIVYAGSLDGNVYALDASTGALKWNYTIENGVSASPAAIARGVFSIGDQ
jgi:outer membrane protein assembly factor BamB